MHSTNAHAPAAYLSLPVSLSLQAQTKPLSSRHTPYNKHKMSSSQQCPLQVLSSLSLSPRVQNVVMPFRLPRASHLYWSFFFVSSAPLRVNLPSSPLTSSPLRASPAPACPKPRIHAPAH